ncbi:type II secretion system [Azospirillum sp. B510]|uniref:type II secretion system F family protein n=1 Tax=Azospirillum sp. (strain B510) TaxID=137722 RepID=UPI0001C4BA86|nr:type II secretion system F family protein [Azospirillum sp. B510]BAI70770.1 type II secretion system [Azospirillum sp. B510]
MTPEILAALAPGLGAFLLILGVILLALVLRGALTERRRAVSNRLTALSAPVSVVADGETLLSVDEGAGERDGLMRRLEALIEPAGGWAAARPAALGAVAAFAVALFLAGRALSLPPALAIAVLVGLGAGRQILGMLTHRRTIRFLDRLPDAIDLVVRASRAGVPVSEAIIAAGRETEEPVRSEFRRVADQVSIGVDLKDALRQSSARVRLPDFDFFVVALVVQRETGGQLAETLGNLSDILRKRKDMRLKVKALTAEGRMSANIVASLPFVSGGLIFAVDPTYVLNLFTDPLGHKLLAAAAACLGLGMFVIGRMTRAEA